MTYEALVPLPVILSLLGAGLTVVASGHTLIQRAVSGIILGGNVAVAGALLWFVDTRHTLVVRVGGWAPTEGIVLYVDRLAAVMLLISAIVTFAVMLYSVGQGRLSSDYHDGEAPLPIFHPTLLVLAAGVNTTFIAGDLFHLYVGFEMLLFASFVLLTLGGTASRVRAGANYVVVNLLSSLCFLFAIAMVYAATGSVNMAQVAERVQALDSGARLMIFLVLLVGFGVKAALFPMSGWLPDSYPTAPAPVTAVFAGLLTKVGVYAIIRTRMTLVDDDRLDVLLLWAGLLTMLVGILGAVAQDEIKRLLSFTLVSHIGFMIFGIAIGNDRGLSSAIYYAAHHITIQTCLFLVIGLIEVRAGTTSLHRMGGLARLAPGLAVLFLVPTLNLAGIPPFSGFLGKVGLIQAGVDNGGWLAYALVAGSVITSLLTLYAVSRVWVRAFWRAPRCVEETSDGDVDVEGDSAVALVRSRGLSRGIVIPTLLLFGVSLGLSAVAGPLFDVTGRAAGQLTDSAAYRMTVLEEAP